MAISSKPRPKSTVSHKKRRGNHHKRNDAYLKTYWPYIPMLAIVAGGVYINSKWAVESNLISSAGYNPTRFEAMIGSQNEIAVLVIIAMAAIAAIIFVTQHWFRIRRLINKGEMWVVKHPWLDILLIAVCTVGFILTRSTIN